MGNQYIGIDLGGTNVRAGLILGDKLKDLKSSRIDSKGSVDKVLSQIFDVIDSLDAGHVDGIGIGVPSVVDTKTGVVYDVQNIPSWKEVPVKEILEQRYNTTAVVNNDANCFALAEKHFGKGIDHSSMIGLIIGTGVAAGVIIDGKLYEGANCGSGEFGMIKYLDSYYELYCSGQFFKREYGLSGEDLFNGAKNGEQDSLDKFSQYGVHLGHAIETILYSYDPELIVLGGSVSQAFEYCEEAVWKVLEGCIFQNSVERLQIKVSELEHPGVLGAAALNYASS